MNFWPIEEPALEKDEVLVTRLQFEALARLTERRDSGMPEAEYTRQCLQICPDLKTGRTNRLVVRQPQRKMFW